MLLFDYAPKLKDLARSLRSNMTDSEQLLWSRLRGKQLHGIQFYRQKPIGKYIVDFYAPKAMLVIEVDGSQHQENEHRHHDDIRDQYLVAQGLKVLRFNSREVLTDSDTVVEAVYEETGARLKS